MKESKASLEIYTKTAAIWDAMYADCGAAEKSIEFEQYILKDDKAGHRFLKLFTEKAKQGVRVRLMLDSLGSRELSLSPAFAAFKEAGGIAYFYNPVRLAALFTPSRLLPRSHVKTLLIDGTLCYTGSACIWEIMSGWHDLQARFTGPLAAEVKKDFAWLWAKAGRKKTLKRISGEQECYVVSQWGRPNRIYRALLRGIHEAKKEIRIVTPYFLPPWLLRHALYKAVRRGVEVKVMVSENTDVPIADYVSRSYYPVLFRHGVRIFHYKKTVLHAKYVMIDDAWVSIGSTNMDYLSLMQNREANIFLVDKEAAMKVRHDFDLCMKECHEVSMAYCLRRPWIERTLGYLGRVMRKVL